MVHQIQSLKSLVFPIFNIWPMPCSVAPCDPERGQGKEPDVLENDKEEEEEKTSALNKITCKFKKKEVEDSFKYWARTRMHSQTETINMGRTTKSNIKNKENKIEEEEKVGMGSARWVRYNTLSCVLMTLMFGLKGLFMWKFTGCVTASWVCVLLGSTSCLLSGGAAYVPHLRSGPIIFSCLQHFCAHIVSGQHVRSSLFSN